MFRMAESTVSRGRRTQHDRNIQEVQKYSSDCAVEIVDVATTNALAEENAVVVMIFDAYVTVIAMLR